MGILLVFTRFGGHNPGWCELFEISSQQLTLEYYALVTWALSHQVLNLKPSNAYGRTEGNPQMG